MYELDRPPVCSVGRAMEILGERWTMLIMREAFYGVRRFSDMQRNLGIARNNRPGRTPDAIPPPRLQLARRP
jgi:DNA-binding HxlR family transcriptional regulator